VLTQFVLLAAIAILGPSWHCEQRTLACTSASVVLFGISAGCGLAGSWSLGRNLTPFPRPVPAATLVTTGIYAVMRHPLYVAVLTGALAWACVWQSWAAMVVSVVLAVFFDAKARREERLLRERFADYAAYASRVSRFIPWVY
jgi:protein-S-isoprenylcysteine O-methyltransferase Ste14